MRANRVGGWLLASVLVLGGAVWELALPLVSATCAECGNGPRDQKCPRGYQCVDSQCVKR